MSDIDFQYFVLDFQGITSKNSETVVSNLNV